MIDAQMGRIQRLALSIAITLSTCTLQFFLWEYINPFVWFLFYPAVFFTAVLTGLEGGILATVMSTVLAWYFFITPRFSFHLERPGVFFSILVFAAMGLIFSLFSERLHELYRRIASKDSDARLRAVLDGGADAIFALTPEGKISYANEQAAQMLGYSIAELMTMGIPDAVQAESLPAAMELFEQLKKEGHLRVAFNLKHRNGSIVPVEVNAVALPDGKLFISCRDIAESIRDKEALERIEQRYRAAFQMSLDSINITAMDGRYIEVNQAFLDCTGYTRDEVIGRTSLELNIWVDPADRLRLVEAIKRDSFCRDLDACFRKKNGEYLWGLMSATVIELDGETRILSVTRDFTERKLAEARLQLAANVFTHAREGIAITDAKGDIIEVNGTFTQITGYSREEVIGKNPRILKSGRQSQEFYANLWQTLVDHGSWSGEVWNRRKDGEVYAELLTISAVHDADGKVTNYVALFTDITSIKEHQKQLEYIAHYDALTSLPNRRLMADRLHQAMNQSLRRDQSVAVAYLDLDGFKAVNDKYGHEVGDKLLIALSQRIRDALRDGDTLSRFGGDEFVAVLVDLDDACDCEPVLSRLLQAAASPEIIDGLSLQVSASIGVTLFPQDNADADQLIRHADQAMYLAKQSGKNRYHLFDVSQDAAVKTLRASLDDILRALDHHEFVLYYQPKVNMRTGQVVGAEALIRWQHPERGLLLPGDFLPIIEDHPIAVALGKWVINTALEQMAAWQAQGLSVAVSVNVGARQLQQDDFVQYLQDKVTAHPTVSSGQLEIEILESSALEDVTQVSGIMQACRAMGVRFALDDFGTGFSSLTYLRRLPAETVKIDQSFVRNITQSSEDLAIIKGVIGLAGAFHREVIAEGVETIAHGTLLLSLGCDLAQGYGIARPMAAALLPNWAATWKTAPEWKACAAA
ncbi:MAG TPA: EAL domain-containing protein [Rhodocyclaceae bacterium]|jgi:diguanylate cyclase (GGDEF)-like protein/PAS domain S-box-containing protein